MAGPNFDQPELVERRKTRSTQNLANHTPELGTLVFGCLGRELRRISIECRLRGASMVGPKVDRPELSASNGAQGSDSDCISFSGADSGHVLCVSL